MASIRILKKNINNLTFELISECYVYKHFHKNEKASKKVDGIIEDIVKKRNELIERANKPDINSDKKYFQSLKSDMVKMVELMDKLSK